MSDDCDCGTGLPALDRHPRGNRPGLPAVAYRLGTFARFREALLEEISRTAELDRLRSRISDDYSVSTVEMWSAVADILTFYSERIANEAFLRTATARDSVLRLVRLIDYHLAPGIAAQTVLGFTLEPSAALTIPARTRVQSVPAHGEKPQKYETLEPLTADARLNRLRLYPAPVPKNPFHPENTTAIAAPDPDSIEAVSALAKGDRVLVYSSDTVEILTVQDVTVAEDLVIVRWSKPIHASTLGGAVDGTHVGTQAYRLGRTFRLFGVDAPHSIVVVKPRKDEDGNDVDGKVDVSTLDTNVELTDSEKDGTAVGLDGRYENMTPGQSLLAACQEADATEAVPFSIESTATKEATRTAGDGASVAASGTVTHLELKGLGLKKFTDLDPTNFRHITIYELLGKPLRFWPYAYPAVLTSETVYLPGTRVGWSTIDVGRSIEKGKYGPGIPLSPRDLVVGKRVVVCDGAGAPPAVADIVGAALTGSDVTITADAANTGALSKLGLGVAAISRTALVSAPLDKEIALLAGSELSVTIGTLPTQIIAPDVAAGKGETAATIAGKLQKAIRAALPAEEAFARAVVWADSEVDPCRILVAAGVPGTQVRFAHSANDDRTIEALGLGAAQARFADGLLSGRPVPDKVKGTVQIRTGFSWPREVSFDLSAKSAAGWAKQLTENLHLPVAATPEGRLLFMPRLPVTAGVEWLRLTLSGLPEALDRDTAYLLGNIADASHGETVRDEIVGDGDAAAAFQQFPLAKKPLTVSTAPTPSGVSSSLRLFVDGEIWTEVPSLFGSSAVDRVFTTRTADDGTTTVGFGDGVHGTRPTTGRQNILATYRQGSGIAGRVPARALRTLLDRPTGVKATFNPLPGEGGSDAETLDTSRRSAPASVRTFGRAISLLDFEDSTLTNREVAKARSQWVWAGDRRVVHVTVAGEGGQMFTRPGLARLAARFHAGRDPNRPLLIDNYLPIAITISGTLTVDPRYLAATVLEAANNAVLHAFAFERRAFAEPVHLSDVIATLQNSDGVNGVDIDVLDLKSSNAAFRRAHGAVDLPPGRPQPRLLMLPARWSATDKKVLPAELAVIEIPVLDVTLRATGGLPS